MARKKTKTLKGPSKKNKSKKELNKISKKKSKQNSKKSKLKKNKMEPNKNTEIGFINIYEIPELKRIITQYSYEPKEYVVYQGYTNTVEDFLKKGNVHDTIYYCTDNQLGCVRYRIIINENNEKELEQIWSAADEGVF